uniref:LITAF domain-containing protein n=1 Tax=Paramormyrops kingsleyae TaxID=1676925 RepID=A0A3B3SNH4_9TELE
CTLSPAIEEPSHPQPPPPPPPPTHAYQQPIISSGNLGAEPCLTTCTNCRERVTTNVIYKPGALTWVVCLTLILFGFVFGCCLIPFCMDICQDAHHSCPKCHTSLHVHKRL